MKKIIFSIIVATLFTNVQGRDITGLVINNTDFDEKVARACSGKCGNRGWSRLDSISANHISGVNYNVISHATAKYHQHTNPPKVFGVSDGGGIGVQYTIGVTAYGTLNSSNCILTINKINISGDQLNIANGAKNEEGKTHKIKNCNTFL